MKLVKIPGIGQFQTLKPGCIHMRCSRCNKTRSNVRRSEFDLEGAAVIVTNYCDRCDSGGEFGESWYFDSRGKEISWS